MRIAAAGLLLLADLAAFTWLARRARKLPVAISAAVGLGLLVAWQAVAVEVLSAFRAVNGPALAVVAGVPSILATWLAGRACGGAGAVLRRAARSVRWSVVGHGWPPALALPLIGVVAAVAASHAPNNWDSMTYHLARVAHWIQRGSAGPYETGVFRQVHYGPGAENLLLALQAISGSDRLANGLQLVAWLVVLAAAAPLARLAGAPRRVAAWAGPIVAGTPMLVLQATSTQNDLVAAVLALALVAASLPLLHGSPRPRGADLALLGALGGAAFLVKATALVCAAPVLALALAGVFRAARSGRGKAVGAGLLAGAVLLAGVAGPHAARMASAGDRARELTTPYVFPAFGEWPARAASLRAAATRHLPAGLDLLPDLAGRPSALPPFHEDLAANPLQALLAVAGVSLVAAGGRRVRRRARWAAVALVAAWVLFQATFRPNAWVSRLETPLFALLPATMGGWAALRAPAVRSAILAAAAALSVALGIRAAFLNPSRPAARVFAPRTPADDYYANRPSQRPAHDAALEAARRTGCRRLGLHVGEDSYDYPLTWRAMQLGIEVRHVQGPDPWPCVIVSDQGPPPEGTTDQGGSWRPVLQLMARRGGADVVAGGVWIRP